MRVDYRSSNSFLSKRTNYNSKSYKNELRKTVNKISLRNNYKFSPTLDINSLETFKHKFNLISAGRIPKQIPFTIRPSETKTCMNLNNRHNTRHLAHRRQIPNRECSLVRRAKAHEEILIN